MAVAPWKSSALARMIMVELSAEAHGVMRVMLILHPRVAAIGTHILRELLWTIAMATL